MGFVFSNIQVIVRNIGNQKLGREYRKCRFEGTSITYFFVFNNQLNGEIHWLLLTRVDKYKTI